MALSPAVLEARIHLRVSELQVLAARTAVDWDAQALKRELATRDRPLVRRLARALLDASKMTLDEACKTDSERLAVEKELELLRRAIKIAKETPKSAGSSGQK
jgi:hypothetical protein